MLAGILAADSERNGVSRREQLARIPIPNERATRPPLAESVNLQEPTVGSRRGLALAASSKAQANEPKREERKGGRLRDFPVAAEVHADM